MRYRNKFCQLHKEPLIFGGYIFGSYCRKCCKPLRLSDEEENLDYIFTLINPGTPQARFMPIPFTYEEAICVRERGIAIRFVEYHLTQGRDECATCGISLTRE